jgi:hypothetical protein
VYFPRPYWCPHYHSVFQRCKPVYSREYIFPILSFQVSCKLSFSFVGLKISFLHTVALKYSNKHFFCGT